MQTRLGFAWACVKDAAKGTTDKANAWAWLIGTFALWGILYWQGYELLPPTTMPGIIFLGAISLVVAWLIVFLWRFMGAPYRLHQVTLLRLQSQQPLASSKTEPNWPIRELFLHISPTALDHPTESLWVRVGDKVRDALSLGRLRIWGRPHETNLKKLVGERPALRLIDPSYWQEAHFTYSFFYAQTEDAHCYAGGNTGLPSYTDLQVNRAEALALWPGEPPEIAESYPNIRIADNPSIQELLNSNERTKLLGLLSAGKLDAWARPMHGPRDFVKIPKDAWENHFVDIHLNSGESINKDGAFKTHSQTYFRTKLKKDSTHYDVCLNKTQVLKIWPSLLLTEDSEGDGA